MSSPIIPVGLSNVSENVVKLDASKCHARLKFPSNPCDMLLRTKQTWLTAIVLGLSIAIVLYLCANILAVAAYDPIL